MSEVTYNKESPTELSFKHETKIVYSREYVKVKIENLTNEVNDWKNILSEMDKQGIKTKADLLEDPE